MVSTCSFFFFWLMLLTSLYPLSTAVSKFSHHHLNPRICRGANGAAGVNTASKAFETPLNQLISENAPESNFLHSDSAAASILPWSCRKFMKKIVI